MSRILLVLVLAFAALGAFAWSTDKITMQGERTVYTVACSQGVWDGNRCSGKLVAGARYRFRALRAHSEVLFWTVGASEPSGKFTDCTVVDGQNWSCKASAEAARTITREMIHGQPTSDPSVNTLPFHETPKWKWMLLRMGVPVAGSMSQ